MHFFFSWNKKKIYRALSPLLFYLWTIERKKYGFEKFFFSQNLVFIILCFSFLSCFSFRLFEKWNRHENNTKTNKKIMRNIGQESNSAYFLHVKILSIRSIKLLLQLVFIFCCKVHFSLANWWCFYRKCNKMIALIDTQKNELKLWHSLIRCAWSNAYWAWRPLKFSCKREIIMEQRSLN